MDNFRLKIITPERIFFDKDAYMVELNTTEGEIGVYAGHIPTTCIIKPGILTIRMDGEEKEAALHSGFVQILQDEITLLAEVVEWPEEIDENRAKEAQLRAERRLAMKDPNVNVQRAEMALHRALTRQEVKKV